MSRCPPRVEHSGRVCFLEDCHRLMLSDGTPRMWSSIEKLCSVHMAIERARGLLRMCKADQQRTRSLRGFLACPNISSSGATVQVTTQRSGSHARRAHCDRVGANRDSCFAGATSTEHPRNEPAAWFRQAASKSTMLRIQVSKTMRITSRHYRGSQRGQAVRLRAPG